MQKLKFKRKTIIGISLSSLIAALMVALFVLSAVFSDTISLFLYGISGNVDPEILSQGAALCEDITEEGTVLLKNQKMSDGSNALPLKEEELANVNVFGWAAYDWMTSAFGSGYSNTSLEKVKFFPALEKAGINYNTTLYDMYKDFYSDPVNKWGMTLNEYRGDVEVGGARKFILHEPGADFYTDEVINEAKAFSSVALVVIGRTGAEAADLRMEQTKQVQMSGNSVGTKVDNSRHYLEISIEEEEMIAAAKKACEKVIVLLNTSNTMETGFLDDDGIDAAMLVGLTGLTGVNAVVDLLRGEKEVVGEDGTKSTVSVSPSGKTTDTYAYDIMSAPSSFNSGYGGAQKYTGLSTSDNYSKGYYDAYVDYSEGIYVGYRYYETAAAENFIDYEETVQYPFGYGLSYTEFSWSVTSVLVNDVEQDMNSAPTLTADSEITINIDVTNTGSVAGKDVVELYYTAPYDDGKIEKSEVVLGDFVKTPIIEPTQTESVTVSLKTSDMASYDCYDANTNGHKGYELDGGAYYLSLRTDSHKLAEMAESSVTGAVLNFSIPTGGYQYEVDTKTGNPVENRFTGDSTIDNCDLDGSRESTPVSYMTRSNLSETFPTAKSVRSRNSTSYDIARAIAPTAAQLEATGYGSVETPLTAATFGMTVEDMLEVTDYESEDWKLLTEQLYYSELVTLIQDGYFKTAALPSVGKAQYVDLDGPLGLNTRVTSNASCSFVAYPGETLLAQSWNETLAYAMGLSVGSEAAASEDPIRGWYGPGANLHRNPFGGRNGEYYSEDVLLSGRFAAQTIKGATNMGLYCYMKHFAVNDSESLREGLYTFLTEQTLREIYLRPFEIAVKEGGANAVMTSMNRVGCVWTGASRALCTDILRTEWGFRGTLVTDWVDTGSASAYMPVYKGVWAGNDIWLNNCNATTLLRESDLTSNAAFTLLAQNVAHNVLYTLVNSEQAKRAYDENAVTDFSKGFTYNRTWYAYVAIIEVVLLLGIGAIVFFMIVRPRLKEKKESKESKESEI